MNEQNEKKIITITGQRGSGKSTLVKQILPSKTRLLVYDTLGEYNAHGVVINNLPDLAKFWTTTHRGNFKIIYQPLDPFGEFDIICRLIFECGNVCFCVEEIDSFISRSPAGLDYSFLNIVQRGRHKHIELIAITQRPFAIPPILRSQTKVFYSFCQMESRDIDWYKNIYGDSADELRNLKTFEYLVYDNGNVSNGKTSY
jgi:energy-coupling factor transporter ATP-binding protein EcfA2